VKYGHDAVARELNVKLYAVTCKAGALKRGKRIFGNAAAVQSAVSIAAKKLAVHRFFNTGAHK
jgi:hypothetical protein